MRVGWAHVDEDRVERLDAGREELRDVRQKDGHVVGATLVHRRSRVGADEERSMAEALGHLRRQVRRGPLGVDVNHADVTQLRGARDEGVQEHRRRRRPAMHEHLLPGTDARDGFLGGDDLHASSLPDGWCARAGLRTLHIGPSGPAFATAIRTRMQ